MQGQKTAPGVAVAATGFGLKGPRGWVFRGVGFDAPPGSLIAVAGPSGSGRTSLLLALTGRMKPGEGRATVGGHRLPKEMSAVRRISALAHVPGVTDLDPALTVGEHLRERALLEARFGDSLRALLHPRAERAARATRRIDTALAAAGLDPASLLKGSRTAVRDLERLEALRLAVALALIGRPRLLALDDTDLKLQARERAAPWDLLRSLAEAGTTVVAVCAEAPRGAVVVSTAPDGGGRRGAQDGPGEAVPERREGRAGAAATPPDAAGGATRDGRGPHRESAGGTHDPRHEPTSDEPSGDGDHDDEETADALAETGRA
ncbi:ATP-binding cassette domain-containing protein [Streptomyces sp. NPDC046984]|uniref:ATP-binding cassette domain-containing protein n=1 Tax=Streptomyces sp. NPDC046984 TaxID=3155138 RepID=UPI00340A2F0F